MGRLLWLSLTDEGLRKLTCRAVSRRLEMARATREGAALISAIDCQLGENRATHSLTCDIGPSSVLSVWSPIRKFVPWRAVTFE